MSRRTKPTAAQLDRLRHSDPDAFAAELVERTRRGRRPRAPEVHLVLYVLLDATARRPAYESDADAMRSALARLQPVQLYPVHRNRREVPMGADLNALLDSLQAHVDDLAAAMPAFVARRHNRGRAGKPEALDVLVSALVPLLGGAPVTAEDVRKLREARPLP